MANTVRGFPYADLTDPADAQASMQELADFLEANGMKYAIGTLAARPAAAAANRATFYLVDAGAGAGTFYFSDGAAWLAIGITDHGLLTGLGDDDHLQYLLTTGDDTTTGRLRAQDGFVEDRHAQGNQAAAWTPDLRNGLIQTVTLTANITINAPTNPPAAGETIALTLLVRQDAVGSRVVTWAAAYKWPDDIAPVLTTTANRTDVVTFLSHDGGATWLGFLGNKGFNV